MNLKIIGRSGPGIAGLAVLVAGATTSWDTSRAADEFAGKTITVAIGSRAGGSYDAYGRLVARHIGKHIPGKPTVIPKNMPGAAGTRVANYVYNVAPKDGTYLGATLNQLPLTQLLRPAKAKYEAGKFNWIGALNSPANVMATWHTSGIKSIADARKREVTIGATTAASTMDMYPRMVNSLFGTKFKVVLGYRGGKGVNLAMERGEVEGRGSNSWLSYKMRNTNWIKEGKINILTQMTLKRDPDLPNVPTLIELAKSDEHKKIISVLAKTETIGRSLMAPPGLKPRTVKTLRKAFDALLTDREMLADAKKSKLPIKPTQGEELQKLVVSIFETPKPIMDKFLAVVRANEKK